MNNRWSSLPETRYSPSWLHLTPNQPTVSNSEYHTIVYLHILCVHSIHMTSLISRSTLLSRTMISLLPVSKSATQYSESSEITSVSVHNSMGRRYCLLCVIVRRCLCRPERREALLEMKSALCSSSFVVLVRYLLLWVTCDQFDFRLRSECHARLRQSHT